MLDSQGIQELLAKVPRPPDESLPGGLSNDTLSGFEHRTGIPLPNDLREWLRTTNGPCIGPGGIYGIHPTRTFLDIEGYYKIFPGWQSKKWIPIAGDGCGNYYVLATQHEYGIGFPVFFIDTSISSDIPTYVVASDLWRFLAFLLKRELGESGWPFDQRVVRNADPEIDRVRNIALPWGAARDF